MTSMTVQKTGNMTEEEAKAILRTIYAMYEHEPLKQEAVRVEYVKVLTRFNTETVAEAIDNIFKTMKYCPKPSDIYQECRALLSTETAVKQDSAEISCYVCEDKGAIMHIVDGKATALYCDQCSTGRENMYDGRSINDKKHRSNYYMEAISKHIDPEDLRAKNLFKKREVVPPPAYVKELIIKASRRWSM
jgi:DNA-directed RNA polymerase subunit F